MPGWIKNTTRCYSWVTALTMPSSKHILALLYVNQKRRKLSQKFICPKMKVSYISTALLNTKSQHNYHLREENSANMFGPFKRIPQE